MEANMRIFLLAATAVILEAALNSGAWAQNSSFVGKRIGLHILEDGQADFGNRILERATLKFPQMLQSDTKGNSKLTPISSKGQTCQTVTVDSSSYINIDDYINNPTALSFAMRRVEGRHKLLVVRREDTLNLTNAADPFSSSTRLSFQKIWELDEQLFELSLQYAQLQVAKGLSDLLLGDASYLNAVFTSASCSSSSVSPKVEGSEPSYLVSTGDKVFELKDFNALKSYVYEVVVGSVASGATCAN